MVSPQDPHSTSGNEPSVVLSQEWLLDLLMETGERIEANRNKTIVADSGYAEHVYPAWELVKLYTNCVERGSSERHNVVWEQRWNDAGESVSWEGALPARKIARKHSPIWQALGNGTGGHHDALGNPFPPFAVGSGMGWRAVSRSECTQLGLDVASSGDPHSPASSRVCASFGRFSLKEQVELKEELRQLLGEDNHG